MTRMPTSNLRSKCIPCVLLAASVIAAPARVAAAPLFSAPFLSFDVGGSPFAVSIGDLNADGKPDLVAANSGTNTVSVLLGTGDASFGVRADLATGNHPVSVAIGDLNRDGRPDLAVANSSSGTVSVLLGNGDGTFGVKTDFATGSIPQSVTIGDLNRDGRPDLATAN